MKSKKDALAVIICIVFLLANLAAIGPGGRRRAREALCLSRLMTWGQVFQSYTAENNGCFHQRSIGSQAGYSQMWLWTYEPYYDDKEMLCCPAAENPECDFGTFGTWGGPNWKRDDYGSWDPDDETFCGPNPPYYGSYGFNRYVIDMRGGYQNDQRYWRRAGCKGASNVPVLLDCMYVTLFWIEDDSPPEYDGDFSAGSGISLSCINRHNESVNVCFMDFSARKVGLKELWTLKGNRLFDTCGPWTTCGGVQPSDWPEWMRDFKDY